MISRKIFSKRYLSLLIIPALLVVGLAAGSSQAASKSTTSKKPIDSQTASPSATGNGSVSDYAANSDLQYGTIVRLDKKDNQKVVPATQKNAQDMYGVVVDPNLLSITFSNSKYKHEVYVATSGRYDTLVSNQNGPIKAGDYIALSSVDGIAMNAGNGEVTVFGRAIRGFDGKTDVVGTSNLKDSSGKTIKKVSFGTIPVAVNIQRNPNEKSTKLNAPNALQRVGEQIADKPITPARLYLGAAILGLTLCVAIVILYSGIRSSLISLGRNPLSKKSILRGLIEVILSALVVLIIGVFAVYLLLKL